MGQPVPKGGVSYDDASSIGSHGHSHTKSTYLRFLDGLQAGYLLDQIGVFFSELRCALYGAGVGNLGFLEGSYILEKPGVFFLELIPILSNESQRFLDLQ
jgi:hypothetical protein